MSAKTTLARNLAAAILAGDWSRSTMLQRVTEACGRKGKWLEKLVQHVLDQFGSRHNTLQQDELTAYLKNDRTFNRKWNDLRNATTPLLRRVFWPPVAMLPVDGIPATWSIPHIASTGRLADWCSCSPTQLDWYVGRYTQRGTVPETKFPRYRYHWLAKRSRRWRLLEQPIFALKRIQRRLLRNLLNELPPHDAVCSYRPGRSLTNFVEPHVGQRVVIRFDLHEFFPSVRASRIHALFARLGYPNDVVRSLAGLCTNAVPNSVFERPFLDADTRRRLLRLYSSPHLPQGAPTSPMLSNLCAFRFDVRLAGLAKSMNARYTRYADDLAFSGDRDLERSYQRFHVAVCLIALEEGFEINTRKTRLMRQGVRQQLAGVTVNVRPNVARREYDRLKAILFNCCRHGPDSQNREGVADFRAVLLGRIQWVSMIHAEKGHKLKAMFKRIEWAS